MEHPILEELKARDSRAHEESIRAAMLLTLAIGILNACTYLTRGGVFASSQSGNLLYLGLDYAAGCFDHTEKYLFPVIMFAVGILIAEHYRDKPDLPRWRRVPMGVEIVLITVATFLPEKYNALANPIFGLCCGLQSITFRKIGDIPVQTVFINGSYQNALIHWFRWLHLNQSQDRLRSALYLIIVVIYLVGVIAGGLLCQIFGRWTSLFSAGILLLASIVMHHMHTHAKKN